MDDPTNIRLITTNLVAGRGPGEWTREVIEASVSTEQIKAGMNTLLVQMAAMFRIDPGSDPTIGDTPTSVDKLGAIQLEEVSFSAEIGGDGQFKLVGTNNPSVAGGIRFTMKRKHIAETADLVRHLIGTEVVTEVKDNKLRSHLTTLDGDPAVRVKVEGVVPVAEQNLPLPVVGI
jgi:hypothetical protein